MFLFLRISKARKIPGPDEIPMNIWWRKHIFSDGILQPSLPNWETFRRLDWQKTIFIVLPKNNKTVRCNDFQLISLMRHSLMILLNRIYAKSEQNNGKEQFATFLHEVIITKELWVSKRYLYIFIDFDRVKHTKFVQCLKLCNIDYYDMCLLLNLYHNQRAVVRLDDSVSDESPIKSGVRQGRVVSPHAWRQVRHPKKRRMSKYVLLICV